MQSGWAVGWGIAATATLSLTALPQEIARRALFWVGLSPPLLAFFVRQRSVEDPPVFEKRQKNLAATRDTANFLEIFSPTMLPTTVLACLLTTGARGGYYAITLWLPTFLQTERQFTVIGSGGYLAVVILGAFTGYLLSASINDRIGRRWNIILFAVCSIHVVTAYTLIPMNDVLRLVLGFPLGCLASGIFSGMGAGADGIVPHPNPRLRPGFRPQYRARRRRLEPVIRRLAQRGSGWAIDGDICPDRLRPRGHRAVSPGNHRSRAGCARRVTRDIPLWHINSANLVLRVRFAADR